MGKVFKNCLNTSTLPKKIYSREQKVTGTTKNRDAKVEVEAKDHEPDILADVRECIENMIQKIEKESERRTSETSVIMVSDSDDEKRNEHEAATEIPLSTVHGVQEIMDALMRETMKKETEAMDTDSEISSVTDVAVLAPKTETMQSQNSLPTKDDFEKCAMDGSKVEPKGDKEEECVRSIQVLYFNYRKHKYPSKSCF